MYTSEELSPTTHSQKQILFQNLARLHKASVTNVALDPKTKLGIYAAESETAYMLSIEHVEVNQVGEEASQFKDLVVTKDGCLDRFMDSELGRVKLLAQVAMSADVEAYEETMKLLASTVLNPHAATIASFSPKMTGLINSFGTVGSLEATEYIGLTDQLIERHLPSTDYI